ncbi:7 transmembrane sweet-taste receptor of 3 GCPR-domain-containing protein [Paraphysoderma sedebokerense]|nr:7 transmembrane sweet-taste receptor of 3 GCPR-domain-containing protein [Paraphysoderma sedebokerense]
MLPKTFRIYKVFRRIRALRSSISNRRLLLQSGVIVAINVLFIIIWYSIDVPRVLAIPGADEKKFICASKNTTVDMAFNDIMLIYHGLLIAATTFLAVKVRVARDVFNEAVSIGVSVYGVTTVAIFFVPVSFISSINTQTFFLLRTLASIICATTVLGALFVPKIIAILRPAQLNGKPSDVASSTSPSKRPSQIASSVMSVQTVIQAEVNTCLPAKLIAFD